jgi:NAD(P)-dependent dehydrogenase (short-subunit alcohol dehydrogenase family)
MTQAFTDKVAFVTGAGTGIGAATAEMLAQRGAKVALMGRRPGPLESVAQRIRQAGGEALVTPGDVSRAPDVEQAVTRTVETFGGMHLAVNNAGVAADHKLIPDIELDEWNSIIGINLSGVFYGLKYQIPAMLASGGGAIVNISSVAGDRGVPGRAGYVAAKHGIHGLTRTAALEYASQNIRVNEIRTGMIDTEMASSNPDDSALLIAQTPLGRLGRVEEMAVAICFLLDGGASFVNGACLAVEAGLLA